MPFFEVGDRVRIIENKKMIGVGTVERIVETHHGVFYKLEAVDGVFPEAMLELIENRPLTHQEKLDAYLDAYNRLNELHELTGDVEYKTKANKLMSHLKRGHKINLRSYFKHMEEVE